MVLYIFKDWLLRRLYNSLGEVLFFLLVAFSILFVLKLVFKICVKNLMLSFIFQYLYKFSSTNVYAIYREVNWDLSTFQI